MEWDAMDRATRQRVATLTASAISDRAGVYAFYRDGVAVYVGKAAILRSRLWRNHLRTSVSMTNSALRRNVAEHLGIAAAADIKARRYRPTLEDAAQVSDWIGVCDVSWIECVDDRAARLLEAQLKTEFKPALTKT